MTKNPIRSLAVATTLVLSGTGAVGAADLALHFPLRRDALQTNESVPVQVLRRGTAELAAGVMTTTLAAEDGSSMRAVFALPAVPVQDGTARDTQHLALDVRFLRPGNYTLTVEADGAAATLPFEVYSHLRRSTYKLINWGSPKGAENQRIQGEKEDGLGYNLMYDKPNDLTEYIRAGVDVIPVNVMSGGHQMDLRTECDWSDPYVTRGGTRRVSRAAFKYRTFPNFIGLNFYDEPGLTWHNHPATGEWTPHGIPWQVRSFESANNRPAPQYNTVDPANPESVQAWKEWGSWKLGIMDAAWREAAYGLSQVRPNLIANTQSQYGWSAFTDGYYFNVTCSLPVASGHGGYDDLLGGYFAPSYFLEMSRARDRARPNWYLPTWYRSITDDLMRAENYLSFAVGIQGIMTPPWIEPTGKTPSAKQAIIECNRVMGRLGTIFNTMDATPKPVALLYSMSNNLETQAKDRSVNYAHGYKHGQTLLFCYLAGQISQQPMDAIVDEDVVDGTLAANHQAVVLAGLDYLAPPVVHGLEQFAASGGLVLITANCTVNIQGGINLGVTPVLPEQATVDALVKEIMAAEKRDWTKLKPFRTVGKHLEASAPLAQALASQLAAAGIAPIFETDQPEVVAQRHGNSDVEYLFAINATNDRAMGVEMGILPVTATLSLPDDGRPLYDAMTGAPLTGVKNAAFTPKGKKLVGKLDFAPGQMRVFARTARPIGGIRVGVPGVSVDFTREDEPIRLAITASFVDAAGKILAGSVPLHLQMLDPVGKTRYDLYRATRGGILQMNLPLAANDPAGKWTITVTELLSNQTESLDFTYRPSVRNGQSVGISRRALMLAGEEANLFRFARNHAQVTIVPGNGDYQAAAERLKTIIAPWGMQATILDVDQASQPRTLTEEEARTWIGLNYAPKGSIKAGGENSVEQSGIAVRGAVILLGTEKDNPLIDLLLKQQFLPMSPVAGELPGRARGYIAWQRDALGPGQESVALIAHDAAGMDEAIGTLYEAVAGLQPLTALELPLESEVAPATK